MDFGKLYALTLDAKVQNEKNVALNNFAVL